MSNTYPCSSYISKKFELSNDDKLQILKIVKNIHEESPGQIQSRYLARISYYKKEFKYIKQKYFHDLTTPVHFTNLPRFDDVEESKILLLLLSEILARSVAYLDYNQSYITDIRPTTLSMEKSSGKDLLSMHNDLTFASDKCRPKYL